MTSKPANLETILPAVTGDSRRTSLPSQRQPYKKWAFVLVLFLIWRLWFVPASIFARLYLPFDPHLQPPLAILPPMDFFTSRILGIWGNWDGEWFIHIVQAGYQSGDLSSPYFPLYPLLVKIVFLVCSSEILAGELVSNFCAIVTFILFYELVKYDFSQRVARRSLVCMLVYPTAFYLVACYSESLFLSLVLGAFLAARRYRNWPLIGLLVGLAALTRNMGILLMLPMGWEWFQYYRKQLIISPAAVSPERSDRPKPATGLKAVAAYKKWQINWRGFPWLPTLALLGVPAFLFGSWLLFNRLVWGSPFNFASAVAQKEEWGRKVGWPWQTVGYVFESISRQRTPDDTYSNIFDAWFWFFIVLMFLVGAYFTWRKQLPVSYLIFFAITLLLPMAGPNPAEPLNSFPRYSLLSFPVFVLLGNLKGQWRVFRVLYLVIGFLLLTFLFCRFANWFWVA